MASAVIAAAECVVASAAAFAGGWWLRGLRDWYRAEVAPGHEWDEEHCDG